MKILSQIMWMLLLTLSWTAWGETPTCVSQTALPQGKWSSGNVQYPYQVYVPPGLKAGVCYPLVVNLHGAGATNPVSMVPAQYFLTYGQKITPHFILIPTMSNGWDATKVKTLIDFIVQQNPIDTSRIYGSGQSMGGFGTGALANAYPNLLAAVVAVSGIVWPVDQAAQQTALYAPKIAKLPYWGFHGALDGTVPVQTHRNFITALRANGGTPKYTEFADGKHNIWNKSGQNYVYIASMGVAEFMFAQRRGGTVTPSVTPTPSPSATPIAQQGFHNFAQREWYLLQGVDAIGGVKDSEISRTDIDGLSVRVAWKTINPSVGSYNFASIRQEVARVKKLGKLMQLRIMSGPSAPAWLKDRGVRYLGTIPHPQDDKVLDYWEQLHFELAKEFAAERAIIVVHASGIAPDSAEWLYKAHTTLYSEPDFSGPKMTSNWMRAINIQARAFPNAIISANLGDHDKDWVKETIRQLKSSLPQQIAFQINSLSAKLPTTWLGFQNIQNAGKEGFHSGFQMLCGSDQLDRFGGTWEEMLNKLQTTKAQYLEIYRADIQKSKPRAY